MVERLYGSKDEFSMQSIRKRGNSRSIGAIIEITGKEVEPARV